MRPSSSAGSRELKYGSRPARLKIKKESHPIHKSSNLDQQRAPPVIIYTHAPRIIHTEARHFMALVQKLTGMSGAGTDVDNNAAATALAQAPTSTSTDAASVLDSYNIDLLLDYSMSLSSAPDHHTFLTSALSPQPRPPDVSPSSCLMYQEMPAAAAAGTLPGGWINPSFAYGNLENLF